MSDEATAEALAPVAEALTPTPEAVEEPIQQDTPESAPDAPVEQTEDEMMSEMFDKIQEDEDPDAPEKEASPEGEEVPDEPQAEVEAAPSDLPHAVKEAWKDIPEGARESIVESQREMSRKLADQGRVMQGVNPIKDALIDISETVPAMMNMKPADIARELGALATMSQKFTAEPVQTMMGLIEKHGMGQAVFNALQGKPMQESNQGELHTTIRQLQNQVAQLSDPEYLSGQFNQFSTRESTLNDVTAFSAKSEYWDAVEDKMPMTIEYITSTMPQGTPAKDILKASYDLAVSQFVPDAKVTQKDNAKQAEVVADPQIVKSAIRAKKNVNGAAPSKPRVRTEEELLSDTFDRMQQE